MENKEKKVPEKGTTDETIKQMEKLSDELKNLSNEELDEVAGGYTPTTCPAYCKYIVLKNQCICPKDETD